MEKSCRSFVPQFSLFRGTDLLSDCQPGFAPFLIPRPLAGLRLVTGDSGSGPGLARRAGPGRAGLVGLPGLPVTVTWPRLGRRRSTTTRRARPPANPAHGGPWRPMAAHGGGLGPLRRGAASTLALQDVVLRNDPPANRAHSGALRSTWTQLTRARDTPLRTIPA
jgi:hypothetical protein